MCVFKVEGIRVLGATETNESFFSTYVAAMFDYAFKVSFIAQN